MNLGNMVYFTSDSLWPINLIVVMTYCSLAISCKHKAVLRFISNKEASKPCGNNNGYGITPHLQGVEDCCGGINLPPELQQNVVHLVHHLLPDSAPGLDRLEALQQLKGSVSAAQLPSRYTKRMY